MATSIGPKRLCLEALGVFTVATLFLSALSPTAPFTKELGVCESGAVRDVLAGNLILPRFIPGPMVHVPPLYWWSAAACVRLLGWTELALRLPALVPAAATCAVIYAWATARISREAALWGAAALLLGHFFVDASRQPRMDSMLALFVTAAIVALERAIATRRPGWCVLAALAIGLGCLTKGILGIALPGLVMALYLIVRRRWTELFRRDLVALFVAGLAIGVAWYVAGYEIAGTKFLQWQIGMNLWSRFIPADAGGASYCVHPVWYFAPQIVVGMLPWSLYLPALTAALWPRRRGLSEPLIYALCWFAAIFIFFSASRGKCQVYILPALPPLALLLGWVIVEACAERPVSMWLSRWFAAGSLVVAAGALVMVSGAAAILVRGLPAHLPLPLKLHATDQRFLALFGSLAASHDYRVLSWVVISTLGIFLIWRGVRSRRPVLPAFGVFLIAVAGVRFWFGVMTPALAEAETLKLFTSEVMEVVPPGATIGHIGIEDCDLYFYSSRPIDPVFRFKCDAQPPFPNYLVIRKSRFDAMPSAERACLTPILVSAPVDSIGPRLLLERTPLPPH